MFLMPRDLFGNKMGGFQRKYSQNARFKKGLPWYNSNLITHFKNIVVIFDLKQAHDTTKINFKTLRTHWNWLKHPFTTLWREYTYWRISDVLNWIKWKDYEPWKDLLPHVQSNIIRCIKTIDAKSSSK